MLSPSYFKCCCIIIKNELNIRNINIEKKYCLVTFILNPINISLVLIVIYHSIKSILFNKTNNKYFQIYVSHIFSAKYTGQTKIKGYVENFNAHMLVENSTVIKIGRIFWLKTKEK